MAKTAKKVPVYLRADDVRMLERHLEQAGWPESEKDPATWVRGLVRRALDKLHEKEGA